METAAVNVTKEACDGSVNLKNVAMLTLDCETDDVEFVYNVVPAANPPERGTSG